MTNNSTARHKDLSLEAMRGCAAWVVVAHHFIGAFRPGWNGFPMMLQWTAFHLTGTPLYAFINGKAAVMLFFVLSGYVLTLRFFETGNVQALALAMVKRWPRLAGPAAIATVCSAILWMVGAFHHREAAALTSSIWLDNFASNVSHADWKASLTGAFAQGAWFTFFRGDDWYDTNLWTMRYELLGSYLSWAVAVLITLIVRGRAAWIFVGVLALMLHYCSPYMNAFVVGVVLARAQRSSVLHISRRWAFPSFVVAILLLSFRQPSFDINAAPVTPLLPMTWSVYLHIAASVILILLFARHGPWHRALDNRFGKWMGWMSFAVYLTHPLVILSASSWAYAAWSSSLGSNAAFGAVCALTIVLVTAVSFPLAAFDMWWTRAVGNITLRLIPREQVRG